MVERALEVADGDALVDDEALDLVEDRAVRRVELVGAVDPAGADHVDRQRPVEQAADLHRRGVRAQDHAGVLASRRRTCPAWCGPGGPGARLRASKLSHSASTSGPSATSQPIATKTSLDALLHGREGVARARGAAVVRQRHVDGLLDQHPVVALGLELGLAVLDRGPHRAARLSDALAGLGLGLRGQRADLAVGQGERAAVTGVGERDCLELVEVGGGRDRAQGRGGRAAPPPPATASATSTGS